MLDREPSVAPLSAWREGLLARRSPKNPDVAVPHFDPAEAGVHARVLVLLESPGPRADEGAGSGFVSVDNRDATAATAWRLRNEAGLHDHTVLWNIVPWYLGSVRAPNASETQQGALELRRLLPLLPELRVVITSGTQPTEGWVKYVAPFFVGGLTVINSWHPSQRSMNQPGKRDHLLRAFERAAQLAE